MVHAVPSTRLPFSWSSVTVMPSDAPSAGTHMAHAQSRVQSSEFIRAKQQQTDTHKAGPVPPRAKRHSVNRQDYCNGGAEAAAKANIPAQVVITLRKGPFHQLICDIGRQV